MRKVYLSSKAWAVFINCFFILVLVVTIAKHWDFLRKWYWQKVIVPREGLRIGIFQSDPELGYTHIPNSVGTYTLPYQDKTVVYSIDNLGGRITPNPTNLQGNVVIIGCSWSFGDGVDDEENYPYLLGSKFWPNLKFYNWGTMAYGTSNAFLLLQTRLSKIPQPKLVLYGWIPHHIVRNYQWRQYANRFHQQGRNYVWFDVENNKLINKGLLAPGMGLGDYDPLLSQKHFLVTLHLVVAMNSFLKERKIPFVILRLAPDRGPWHSEGYPEGVDNHFFEIVKRQGINVVDLRDVKGGWIDVNQHPTPLWHENAALAVSTSPLITNILGTSKR